MNSAKATTGRFIHFPWAIYRSMSSKIVIGDKSHLVYVRNPPRSRDGMLDVEGRRLQNLLRPSPLRYCCLQMKLASIRVAHRSRQEELGGIPALDRRNEKCESPS